MLNIKVLLYVLAIVFFIIAFLPIPKKGAWEWLAFACLTASLLV